MITAEAKVIARGMLRDLNPDFVDVDGNEASNTISDRWDTLSTGEQVLVGVCAEVLHFPLWVPAERVTFGDVLARLDSEWLGRVAELLTECAGGRPGGSVADG